MKSRPTLDVDRFIAGGAPLSAPDPAPTPAPSPQAAIESRPAAARAAAAPAATASSSNSKPPARGFKRTSIDLPADLFRQTKLAAVQRDLTFKDIVEQALRAWHGSH